MPWSKTNTIDSLKNKSDKIKEVFAEAANSALKRGLSEEDAIIINSPPDTAFCPGTPSAVIKVNQLDL